jgi:spore coat protein U-like protein
MKYLILLSLRSFSLFAGTTGTLVLKGTIPARLNIAVTPETVAGTLDLTISQTNLLVATAYESSNSKTGYTVALSSANAGKLIETGGESVTYSLKYNDVAVNLAASVTVTDASGGKYKSVAKSIKISYTGTAAEDLTEGDYTDTITLTIAAK